MKALLPCYFPEMTAFALRMSRVYHHKIAAVLNPDSGPGSAATWKEHAPTYSALVRNDSEVWLYLDAVTGPQYSPFLNGKGAFETPHRPRNKTADELKRELAAYAARKLDAAAGLFVDDTTTAEHAKLVAALSPRAVMANPGNWEDAKKFRKLPNAAGLVIYEAEEWLEQMARLKARTGNPALRAFATAKAASGSSLGKISAVPMVEPAKLGKAIADLATKFPPGLLLWHRANGTRGLVAGYKVTADGQPRLVMDIGPAQNYEESPPVAWSATRIDPDADDWQQDAPAPA